MSRYSIYTWNPNDPCFARFGQQKTTKIEVRIFFAPPMASFLETSPPDSKYPGISKPRKHGKRIREMKMFFEGSGFEKTIFVGIAITFFFGGVCKLQAIL